jgi:hypothetical protein
MKLLQHRLFRLALVILPVMLALTHARAEQGVDTIYAGQSRVESVVEYPGVDYYWEIYNDVTGIDFATDPGNCPPSQAYFVGGVNTGPTVEIMWLVPGTYFFKCTATDSCTNNLKVGKMVVLESLAYATLSLVADTVCQGDTAVFTLEFTGGAGPWDVTITDGTNSWTYYDIQTSPFTFPFDGTPTIPGSYQYWVSSVTSGMGFVNNVPGDPVTLIVLPKAVTSPIMRY